MRCRGCHVRSREGSHVNPCEGHVDMSVGEVAIVKDVRQLCEGAHVDPCGVI